MRPFFLLFCSALCLPIADAQPTLHLFPNLNSIGYQIKLPVDYDTDSTAAVAVQYAESGQALHTGFPPTRLRIGAEREIRGSLFQLKTNTLYKIQITLRDSTPMLQTLVLYDSIRTRKEPVIQPGGTLFYVAPNGTGTQYTLTQPGNLKTLLAGGLSCGSTVLLLGGVYDVGEMNLNLTQNCSEGAPIVLMAASGQEPVLDGGSHDAYQWMKTASDSCMYYTALPTALRYNALCLMDSTRLYPYAYRTGPDLLPDLQALGYDVSGFYRDNENLVYIKTKECADPNLSDITFSKYFYALAVEGNNKDNYLYIKGIAFKYYSKGRCDYDVFNNPTGNCYPSFTLRLNNVNHVVVDSCRFVFTNFPVTLGDNSNYNIIQHCKVTDQTGFWSHGAFKQTHPQYNYAAIFPRWGAFGRYLENSGLSLAPGTNMTVVGNIFRDNVVDGVVTGISVGSISDGVIIAETDVDHNLVFRCYDGIDATSLNANIGCINTRIWKNTVFGGPVAFSLIMPTLGPTYLFRNVAHHISERKNHNYDVFFNDCDNVLSDKIWGTGLKLNAGTLNPRPGFIYCMHNTFHGIDTLGFDLYLWQNNWRLLYSRNNIYYNEGKSCFFFDGVKDLSDYSFDSQGDDFFNASTGLIATVQPVNGIAQCDFYNTPTDFNAGLQQATQSNSVNIRQSYSLLPGFRDAQADDYALTDGSPIIDQGILIPGINDDYWGAGPDIGAFEQQILSIEAPLSIEPYLRVFPNPFSQKITVQVTHALARVELYTLAGQLILQVDGHGQTAQQLNLPGYYGVVLLRVIFEDGTTAAAKLLQTKENL